jgi:hypothetical protein
MIYDTSLSKAAAEKQKLGGGLTRWGASVGAVFASLAIRVCRSVFALLSDRHQHHGKLCI